MLQLARASCGLLPVCPVRPQLAVAGCMRLLEARRWMLLVRHSSHRLERVGEVRQFLAPGSIAPVQRWLCKATSLGSWRVVVRFMGETKGRSWVRDAAYPCCVVVHSSGVGFCCRRSQLRSWFRVDTGRVVVGLMVEDGVSGHGRRLCCGWVDAASRPVEALTVASAVSQRNLTRRSSWRGAA